MGIANACNRIATLYCIVDKNKSAAPLRLADSTVNALACALGKLVTKWLKSVLCALCVHAKDFDHIMQQMFRTYLFVHL